MKHVITLCACWVIATSMFVAAQEATDTEPEKVIVVGMITGKEAIWFSPEEGKHAGKKLFIIKKMQAKAKPYLGKKVKLQGQIKLIGDKSMVNYIHKVTPIDEQAAAAESKAPAKTEPESHL